MKKAKRYSICCLCVIGLWTSILYAATPDAFLVKISPDSFDPDEPVDLTITAVSANGQTVTDYDGDIFMEIQGLSDINDYVLPSDGIYFFVPQDLGSKTFSKGLQIKKAGTYTIRVYDIVNDTVAGETTVIVGNAQHSASQNITINSPVAAGVETSSSIAVLASATTLPNSPYQIFLNGQLASQGTTNSAGDISSLITASQTGTNTIQIKILDANNVVIGQSDSINFNFQPINDGTFNNIQIVPGTQLRQGDKAVFTISTAPGVSSVTLTFNNGKSFPMDRIAAGSFSKQVLIEDAGTIQVGATLSTDGNTKNYSSIATLVITPNVSIGQTKYYTTAVDRSSVTIEWELIGQASKFRVAYGNDQNNLNKTVDVAATGIVVQGIDPNGLYYFQITPLDIPGNAIGTPSDIFFVDVSKLTAPVTCVVDNIQIMTEKVGSNYFLTRQPVQHASKYIIYRSDTPVASIASMQKVGETTDTRFQYPFNRYSETKQFAYYAVQALCANGSEIQIDNIKQVEVGPIDTILVAILLAIFVYASYRLMKATQ